MLLLQADPDRRAVAFRVAWYISVAVVLLGAVIIAFSFLGSAAAHPADAVNVVPRATVDVVVLQGADAASWSVKQVVAFAPGAGASVHVWWPAEAQFTGLQWNGSASQPSFVAEGAGRAVVSWPRGEPVDQIAVTFFVPKPFLPAYGVPVRADRVAFALTLEPGYAPPTDAWRLDAGTWRLEAADAAPGTSVPLLPIAPVPPGGPHVLVVIAAAAAVTFGVGAAWTARRAPRLAPDQDAGFLDHLRELQSRLAVVIMGLVALTFGFFTAGTRGVEAYGVAWPVPTIGPAGSVSAVAFQILQHRFVPAGVEVVALRPFDAALTQFLVALFLAFMATLPLMAWEAAGFLGPALLEKEKRFLRRTVPAVVALFAAGVAFAYFVMVPITMTVLYGYAAALGATAFLAVNDLVTFALTLTLIFGIAFQLPVVMVGLARVGVVDGATFVKYWRHAIVVIFILSGIITPDPTIVSQALLGVPLTVLYLLGVVGARWGARGRGSEA